MDGRTKEKILEKYRILYNAMDPEWNYYSKRLGVSFSRDDVMLWIRSMEQDKFITNQVLAIRLKLANELWKKLNEKEL